MVATPKSATKKILSKKYTGMKKKIGKMKW